MGETSTRVRRFSNEISWDWRASSRSMNGHKTGYIAVGISALSNEL